MNKNPLVSIIITTYKGDWKLCRAINSCLNQSYQNIEIIIVDDNGIGTKEQCITANLIKKYLIDSRVIYIPHLKNKNGAAARNTGIEKARGLYLAFLDDDDVYRSDRIEKCVTAIQKSGKDNAAVYVGVITISSSKCVAVTHPNIKGNIQEMLLINQGLFGSGSNIFIPKYVAEKIHGFDVRFKRFQDVEFMIRASKLIYMVPIHEALIIKDNTNVRFVPNYEGLKEATLLLISKFNKEFLSIQRSKEAIYNKYRFLLYHAYKCNDKKAIIDANKLLNSLNLEKINLIKSQIKGTLLKRNQSIIYKAYKEVTGMMTHIQILHMLNAEEREFV